jgi:hypothetical protein
MVAPKTIRIAASLAPLALAALLIEGELHAEATNSQVSHAIVLFELGRTDFEADRFAEALEKFIDSEKIDPGAGTMLNIAYCHERLGKTATAWADYREAAVLAHEEGKLDWERDALERAEMLEKSLARVVVQVDEPKDGAWPEVMLDDTPLPQSLWGEPTPVDPGRHEVLAKAAARRPWTSAFDVEAERVPTTVVVPVLEPETPATEGTRGAGTGSSDSPRRADDEANPWTARRKAALVTAGVGVVALGAGAALALVAKSTYDGAECPVAGHCTSRGLDAQRRAYTELDIASYAAAGGGVVVVGAAILWLWPSRSSGVQVLPAVGVASWGVSAKGAW